MGQQKNKKSKRELQRSSFKEAKFLLVVKRCSSNCLLWPPCSIRNPAQLVKNPPAMQKTQVRLLCREVCWRVDRLPTPVFLGFPFGSAGKESALNVGDLASIPGWKDPLEKGKAVHSSILVWRIPWIVQSMGSQRVRHDRETFIFTFRDV